MTIEPSQILRVKKLHEQRALRQVRDARDKHKAAQTTHKSALATLKQYQKKRPELERALYDDVMNTEVVRQDLDDLNAKIARLRAHEDELREDEQTAAQAVKQADDVRRDAEHTYRHACADRQKIKNLVEDWQAARAREQERVNDRELEEFRITRQSPV